ncbi:uncharacterized protein LOC144332673 [Macaca mulatta]
MWKVENVPDQLGDLAKGIPKQNVEGSLVGKMGHDNLHIRKIHSFDNCLIGYTVPGTASARPRKSAPSSLGRSEAWIRAGTLQDCAADSEGQRQLQLSLGRTEANSRTLAGAARLYLQPFSRDLAGLSQARLFPLAGAHFLRLRLGRGAAGSKAQVGWARLEFRAWQSGRGVWGRVVLVAAPATRARVSAARTLQGRVATFGDATWSGRLGCRGVGRGPAQERRRCWRRSEGVVPWPCWAQSCLLSTVPGKGDGTISRAR